ncbi:MAG: D-alanyl-D-alanine carboxypeptidase family protein [Candidatus Binataceae bacterium]
MVKPWRLARAAALAVAAVVLLAPALACASTYVSHHRRYHRHHRAVHRAAHVPLYHGALLEDAGTGRVLYAYNAGMEWPPASMAKMTLLLVTEEQIRQGRVHLSDPVRISERSAHTSGSRLGLREGQVFPLGELMKAALVKSANDAAVAVAEKIGGSVEGAVRMMNAQAKALGMKHTEFHTVDGLPPRPGHDVDRTTAYDLAIVARALIHRTPLLQWSSHSKLPFDGGRCMLHNTNHLIGHFYGCDGLKTGFTWQAGFNVTVTAKRGDMRLVGVILGAPSNAERFIQAAKLLNWGFANFTAVPLLRSGQVLPVTVQVRSGPAVRPYAAHALNVVVRKSTADAVQVVYDVPHSVVGPVYTGEPLGQVVVRDGASVVTEMPALCPIDFRPAALTPFDRGQAERNAAAARNYGDEGY